MKEKLTCLHFGDPLSEDTDIGPIANEAQFDKILSMVDRPRQEGATIAAGGSRKNVPGFENGFFIEPTILENVSPVKAEIWRKEVFGPVLCVQSFSCNEEAISLANDTDYGLAAGIWTTDEEFASEIASKIDAGTVYINHYRSVSAFAPVGGIKKNPVTAGVRTKRNPGIHAGKGDLERENGFITRSLRQIARFAARV